MDILFKSPGRLILTSSLVAAITLTATTPSFAGNWRENHPRRSEVLGRDNRINNRINSDRGYLGGHFGQLKTEDRAIRAQEQADARFNGGYITRGEQHQLNHEESQLNRQIRNDYNPNQQAGAYSGGHAQPMYPDGGSGHPGYPFGGIPGGAFGHPVYPVGRVPGMINPGGTVLPISYPGGSYVKPIYPAGGYPGGVPGSGTFAQNHPRRAEVLGRDNNINREVNAEKGDLSGHYGQLKREDQAIRQQEQADARYNGGYITPGEQHQLNKEENRLQRQINKDSQ